MRYILAFVVAVFLAGIFVFTFNASRMLSNRTVVINCQLAEISPDFTPEMRKQCREARNK